MRRRDRYLFHILALVVVALSLLLPGSGAAQLGGLPDEWTLQALQVASEQFGVSYRELYVTADCESGGFRPDVVYGPTRGAAGEQGMFQYLGGARHHLWQGSPWWDYSPYDPMAASLATAYWWDRDPTRKYEWSCWRLRVLGRL